MDDRACCHCTTPYPMSDTRCPECGLPREQPKPQATAAAPCEHHSDGAKLTPLAVGAGYRCQVCGQFVFAREVAP